jgi:hypothetical protein
MKNYSLLSILLLLTTAVFSQKEPSGADTIAAIRFESATWEAALDELEYDSTLLDQVVSGNAGRDQAPDRSTPSRLSEGWRTFFKVIFFAAVLALLSWLLLRLIGKGQVRIPSPAKTRQKAVSVEHRTMEEELPEKLKEDELDGLARSGEFREVIRLYYLRTIRMMAEKGLIQWKKEKTNHDYVEELEDPVLAKEFRNLTYLFEHFWYGSFPLTRPTYDRILPSFQKLLEKTGELKGLKRKH